jgi:LacI family transcriptional regulator
MIGIIVQDSSNPYYGDIVRRIEAIFRPHNYDTLVTETHQDLALERHALERMQERQVDGILIFPMTYDRIADLLGYYEARKTHCVVAGPPSEEIPFDCVAVDLASATETAVQYLIELGHRDLAFVCGAPAWQGLGGRVDAFRSQIEQHGLPFRESSIYRCGFHLKDGYEAGRHLLSMHPRPTAVFALNDLLAIGVMRAARDLGLEVPRDVSVVGVDNIELASYVHPALTTVAQPIDQFSKALADLMLGRLNGKEKFKPRRIELPASFLIRESTGKPPARTE